MTNIIFLDFDGPLFSDRVIRYHPANITPYPGDLGLHPIINYWKMDDVSVNMLNMLYDMVDYQIVVSSTWREYHSKDQIRQLFDVNGINAQLADDWATSMIDPASINNGKLCSRATEISDWLSRHTVSNYLILDDESSGDSLNVTDQCDLPPNINKSNIILVHCDIGIDSYRFLTMKQLVKVWK